MSDLALDRPALAKRLRAARNRLPCLVNKGDEIHAIAAELESSSPPTRPEATPRGLTFLHAGDDRVWCVRCNLWKACDGDSDCPEDVADDECPIQQGDESKHQPVTAKQAQGAIDKLWAELREIDDRGANAGDFQCPCCLKRYASYWDGHDLKDYGIHFCGNCAAFLERIDRAAPATDGAGSADVLFAELRTDIDGIAVDAKSIIEACNRDRRLGGHRALAESAMRIATAANKARDRIKFAAGIPSPDGERAR